MPGPTVEIKCSQCGQIGTIRQRDVNRLKRPWLCQACRSLPEHNPNWRGGISTQYYRYKCESVARYPERNRIRRQTRYHIQAGHLVPQPCRVCQSEQVETHHTDYRHWSHVEWLCHTHHLAADAKRRRKEAKR